MGRALWNNPTSSELANSWQLAAAIWMIGIMGVLIEQSVLLLMFSLP